MRTQGGKRKRKAETNFVEAYSGASELAPPPASRDVFAVPAKLRRIMQLKASIAGGTRNFPQANTRPGKGTKSKPSKAGKDPAASNSKGTGVREPSLVSPENHPVPSTGVPDQPPKKHKRSFANKWKKGEQELKMLVEKMDKRIKTGFSAGVRERRKSYLNEKKTRRKDKGKTRDADPLQALNQYDKVEFGDVVQAPPKLSFPRKAVDIKIKEKLKGEQAVLQERLRSEAIEAYRHRKEWSSRPGGKGLPVLSSSAAET